MLAPSSAGTGSGLDRINRLPLPELVTELRGCLDVPRWAHDVAAKRPFEDSTQAFHAAQDAASELTVAEIRSALSAHPRIGERPTVGDAGAHWSRSEQSGVDPADREIQAALREGNEEYERRFGHVYLVCASGRSGAELLEILRSRLANDANTELSIIADELRAISRLRLATLIE